MEAWLGLAYYSPFFPNQKSYSKPPRIFMLNQITIALFATVAVAIPDYYALQNGKSFQSCAYISLADHWFFNEHLTPQITIQFPDSPKKDFDVKTLIMSGPDINQVELDPIPASKVCDSYASNHGFCSYDNIPDSVPVSQFIKEKKNVLPLQQTNLKAQSKIPYVYVASESNVYCIVFQADNIPEEPFEVFVDWQQAYGYILYSDYKYLWLCWYMGLAYIAFTVLYGLSVFRSVSGDKANTVLISPLRNKKYLVQYKVLFYAAVNVLIFLCETIQCAYMNKTGYAASGLLLSFSSFAFLLANTVLTIWLVYNLSLLSMGVYFKMKTNASPQEQSRAKGKKITVVRVICLVLTLELLVYDMESSSIFSLIAGKTDQLSEIIFGEMVTIFVVFGIWGLITCRNMDNRALANRLYLTLFLLGFCFIFEFVLRRTIVSEYVSKNFMRIVNSTTYSYCLDLLVFTAVAFVWKSVTFENNVLTIKH